MNETHEFLCVIYRLDAFRRTPILPKFEELLTSLKSLKHDVLVFDDFNINILKDNQDRTNYENLPTAFGFEVHNFEPTRVTVESRSCVDHIKSNIQLRTENVPSTISDHYKKIVNFPVLVSETQTTESSPVAMKRNLILLIIK